MLSGILWSELEHPNLIKLYTSECKKDYWYLFMELAD